MKEVAAVILSTFVGLLAYGLTAWAVGPFAFLFGIGAAGMSLDICLNGRNE